MSFSSLATWFLWAALIYVVVFLATGVVKAWTSRKQNPEFSEIKNWLWCLLRNGYDGENILYRDRQKRRFIRFEKYTDNAGAPGIKLTFPEIGWGEELLPRLRALAERSGLAFRVSEEGEPDYALVNVGNDVNEAFALCRTIWTGFYGFDEKTSFVRQVGDLSNTNELVYAVAPSRTSDAESTARYLRYLEKRLTHTGHRWLAPILTRSVMVLPALFFLSAMSFLVALVGLPISTLLTLGDPPDWQFELGSIMLQGSKTSLIFFFVYVLPGVVLHRCLSFRTINRRIMTRAEKMFHAPKKMLFVAVPIAVVLVWLGI